MPGPGVVLAAALVVTGLAGCRATTSQPIEVGPGIEVAADQLRPIDRCIFEAGWRATEIHPGRSGSYGAYTWDVPTTFAWEASGEGATAQAMAACRNQFGNLREKTAAEVREIYDRWVLERQCLIDLGFQPTSPPPFEAFESTWRMGPWMPIDGVPFGALGRVAKERCGLEMLD